jgi:glycosyltransferase A (GT-A) superfamily protein (DUF2064 family)
MFSICTNFITVSDNLYKVKRSFDEHRVPDVDMFKYWLGADTVFRKEGKLYFCERIEEAQIITEQPNTNE